MSLRLVKCGLLLPLMFVATASVAKATSHVEDKAKVAKPVPVSTTVASTFPLTWFIGVYQ